MKGKYIALIVAGGLMVGGIGLGAAALATSAFNIENITTEEEQMEETFNISESFKNIRVESDSCNVEYHHATDGKARVDISVPKGCILFPLRCQLYVHMHVHHHKGYKLHSSCHILFYLPRVV